LINKNQQKGLCYWALVKRSTSNLQRDKSFQERPASRLQVGVQVVYKWRF